MNAKNNRRQGHKNTKKPQNKKLQQELDAEKLQQDFKKLLNKIREFVGDDNYIFRGENKNYGKINSKLCRHFEIIMGQAVLQQNGATLDFSFIKQPLASQLEKQFGKNAPKLDFDALEKSLKENIFTQLAQKGDYSLLVEEIQSDLILQEVKEYVDFENEIDVLVELQHYGGITNLIDFSHDLAVALFFACNGEPEKPGRLILLNKKAKGIVSPKKNQNNRIVFQKSVFVQRDNGCIDEREKEVEQIVIPQNLKTPLLTYVENYFNIRTETIYGDLMGYIKNQERHDEAYKEFFSGTIYEHRDLQKMAHRNLQKAADCYTKAINLQPNFVQAYNNRSNTYNAAGEYDLAIADCNKTIELNPNFTAAYNNRGNAYSSKNKQDLAIADYNKAIELNPNMAETYSNRAVAYNIEGKYALALEDCNYAILLDTNFVKAYYNRGVVKVALRHYKQAKEDFEFALQLAKRHGNETVIALAQESIHKLPR